MALLKKTQRSFSGGMLDKDLMGRQDLSKYSQGCLVLENFKVRKQGNVVKRSGTDLVCDFTHIREGGAEIGAAKLVPLVQERESGLYVLFTGRRAYLVSPDGVKMNDGTWSRAPAHAEAPSTLAPYSEEVPFADADLAMLDWCQSGDTLFFAHRSYPPGKMVYSGGELAYERINFRRGNGTPPRISSVVKQGSWNGTGGVVYVEYGVTAVKDGVETAMSTPFATEYNAPWGTGNSIKITIDTSMLEPDSWDCFYIYKKEADVFGLIGTTSTRAAFVDVGSGFSVNGSLYPDYLDEDEQQAYTQFDKAVHLREGANTFAPVRAVTEETVTTVHVSGTNKYNRSESSRTGWEWEYLRDNNGRTTTTTTTGETTRTATAQKRGAANPGDGPDIVFTLPTAGVVMSEFKVGVGSLEHRIAKRTVKERYYVWTFAATPSTYVETYSDETVVLDPKWVGTSSVFTPSAAKYYTAKVEYYNGTTWTESAEFDCDAIVDQSAPGAGWAAGETAGTFVREYEEEQAFSTSDAGACAARMDTYAPTVGGTVRFTGLPAAVNGKPVRKVSLYGWTDNGKTVRARVLVNGIACFLEGAYVNTFTDSYITPDLTITPPKAEDHFLSPGDYPGCVQIYSQRLVYAASANEPFKFWMSCTGDLYNFDVHEYVRASDAISASTAALEMPRINRMLVNRDLMLFSDGGEWQVAPSSGNAVAPSTISAKLQSVIGCAAWIRPLAIDTDIVFCDGSGETLMATKYNFASDGYESSNLSVLSQRLFRNNRIKAMAYVQHPESTIECVLADGTLASLVYMKEHDVCAWSHHVLGGGWKAKDVAANKSVTAGSSHCAFVASRQTVSSGGGLAEPTRQWAVLGLRDIDPNDESLKGNLRMDAVRTETTARAAGEPVPPQVEGGDVAVRVGEVRTTDATDPENPVTVVTHDVWAVGCPFTSVLKTTSPEFTEQETAQMEIKNATEGEVRVIDGSDFTVRQPEVPASRATRMRVPSPVDYAAADFTVTPGDADCKLPLVGTNSWNGSIVVEHDGYLPLAVLSVTTSYRVEFANHANGGSGNE